MLFDKADGKTDHKDENREENFPDPLQGRVFPCNREDCNRISYMERGADPGAGIKGINKAHKSCQYILAGENIRSEILSVRINNIAEHSNSLGAHDKDLQPFEVLHISQQGIDQRAEYKEKPSAIEKQKIFIKRDQIIQTAVDGMALFYRDKVFCQEIKNKVYDPSSQQFQMGKARFIQSAERKAGVINQFFLHGDRPREGYFLDSLFLQYSDKAQQYAPEGLWPEM